MTTWLSQVNHCIESASQSASRCSRNPTDSIGNTKHSGEIMLRHLIRAGAKKWSGRCLFDELRCAIHTKQVQHLAQTGEGLKDGEIIKWFVKPGDVVNQYDMLCRVHSDKATIDVTSVYNGKVETLSSGVGDVVAVGDPLCVISTVEDTNTMEEMKGYRRSMFRAMQKSASIPHCHAFDVVSLKHKINTAQAVKALSKALQQVPIMHAKVDPENESYTIPTAINVGVAMNTTHGLVVPCVYNCQVKTVKQIQKEIERLRHLADSRCLSQEEVEGSTITISNIGSIGIVSGVGVIHPKQASVVTIGKIIQNNTKYNDEQIHSMHISVSSDHRIIDGFTISRFLETFSKNLQSICYDDNDPKVLSDS